MNTYATIAFWSFLGSSVFVALARYFHPAVFSRSIFPLLVLMTVVSGALAIAKKRYE